MGNSYPDRTNFNGVWKINELSKNKITHNNFPRGSTRATWGGGIDDGQPSNVIDYVTMETTGNASDFGDLTVAGEAPNGSGSSTRGFYSGRQGPQVNVIDYITFMSTGNASDFGNLAANTSQHAAVNASDTRGIMAGGAAPGSINVIQFITIASTGNTTDFGDCTAAKYGGPYGSINSNTRSIHGAGSSNVIDFINFSTLGNAVDHGDLPTSNSWGKAGASSQTRGLFAGGAAARTTISSIKIHSTGDTIDFGDLSVGRRGVAGASSRTRAAFGGGDNPAFKNEIDFVTFTSAGTATDFGNLTVARGRLAANSNGHGGLALTS